MDSMVSQQAVPMPASPPPPSSRLPQRRTQHPTASQGNDLRRSSFNSNASSSNDLSNNHNNLQMERVTFHLHSRLCNFGLRHTSSRTRHMFETLLLIVAICCACALLMLHRTFVIAPNRATCLDALEGFDPASADLTHLVILPHNMTIPSTKSAFDRTITIQQPKSKVLWSRRKEQKSTECTLSLDAENENNNDSESPSLKSCSIHEGSTTITTSTNEDSSTTNSYYKEWLESQLSANTLPISYSYSTTKAYLMLPHNHFWLQHEMDVQYILVSPSDPVCFGEPFVQFLLWNCFIGGNTVLLNWLRTFSAHDASSSSSTQQQQKQFQKGYVYNPRTQWLGEFGGDRYRHQTTTRKETMSRKERMIFKWKKLMGKFGVFLRTSFLFFFCTTLVSFTLRETQERMLDFTRELSRRVRQSISLSDLITTHLVQNLVFVPIMLGMMFFLIEFYHGDKFLAFSITSIVWFVEGFSLVCLRSSQGLQYFPYFFFLLFLLFHVYQTAFPDHGFVHLALTVVWCFMLHSMVFFWHRYELPALVLGHVSVNRPRMILQQHENDDDENEYTTNNTTTIERSDFHRASTIGASNTTPLRNDQQHNAWLDESSTRTAVASINGSHLTTPLLTGPQTATTTTTTSINAGTRNSSSSHLSSNGGGTGLLSSRQSFLSTSTASRRTSGLYRLNQEDDSSTGSHLYFMGGEVVVHRRRTPANQSSSNNTQRNRELSPTTLRRGNSIENISGTQSAAIGAPTEDVPISSFIRNESNFSLLSSTSDTYGNGSTHNATTNSNTAIGLDVTGRWSGEPEDDVFATTIHTSTFCDTLPNDTSMDTVHISNVTSQEQQQQRNGGDTATADYTQESGGLQAIFENKMTPRHRNTHQESTRVEGSSTSSNQHQSSLSSSQPSEIQYQRRPPSLSELAHS